MFQSIPLEHTTLTDIPHATTVRALLLDDSNFDRARIRRLSRKADMAIDLDEVGSIAELDAAVGREKYDLIMIDYRLPVGDGMEALQHVLDNPRNRGAGKIMITGDAAVDTAVRAMRGGCHDFLTKEDMDARALNQAMINAMTLARQRQMQELQGEHQREIIRQGLVAALSDAEVQGNVVSLMRQQLLRTLPDRPQLFNVMDPGDVDVLLAGFTDEDEIIFH
jgi:DNA-binding NtrC family response regulator